MVAKTHKHVDGITNTRKYNQIKRERERERKLERERERDINRLPDKQTKRNIEMRVRERERRCRETDIQADKQIGSWTGIERQIYRQTCRQTGIERQKYRQTGT